MLFLSCKNEQSEQQESVSNYIEITKEQFLSENMTIGTPEKIVLEERVYFTGKIVPTVNGIAKINAPVEGIVTEINIFNGQNIQVNEPILEIGGNALMELQQEFAISSSKIKQLQSNYERAKSLYNENIKTENEYLLAESAYKSELATYTLLKHRLQQIGLNISNIDKGNYALSYSIKSPIRGQVSQLNVLLGQYINRENEIAEVVNKNKAELQLSFFENDVSKIARGQKVVFGSMNNNGFDGVGVISRTGIILNPKSNTIDCYAAIDKARSAYFTVNQLVNGEVIVATDSVIALPQNAVLSSGNKKYVVLIAGENEKGYQLKITEVKTGKSDKNNIELIDFNTDKIILLNGAQSIGID